MQELASYVTAQGIDWSAEETSCIELLRDLIRIDTVNPPGNERPAAELLAEFARRAGLEPVIVGPDKNRASIVLRVRGSGAKPPLMVTGHLDVVEADASRWKRPPFSAEIADGCIWGRGAIDMKNMVAMSACVVAMLARQGERLERDVIFAAVADEETGSSKGAHFLVDEHPDLVNAEYALGEVGGFSLHLMGRVFYPIQVAEKGQVWLKARFSGEPGHGSMPREDSSVIKAADAIVRLGQTRLPFHPTDVVRRFLKDLAAGLPYPARFVVPGLGNRALAGFICNRVLKDVSLRRTFSTYLSNTATPTVVRAGSKTNVIPAEATVEIDGRTLPGQSEADILAEIRRVVGNDAALEVLVSQPPVVTEVDTPMYRHLCDTIRKHDPLGIPIPTMIPGFTDAKAWSKLGTQCYGFSPLRFDPGLSFSAMYHGNDERVPVEGVKWGLRVLYDAVRGFAST